MASTKHASDFKEGQHVCYVPLHARGDASHKDCENGVVKRIQGDTIFVNFYRNGMLQHTAEGCYPWQLI